MSLDDLAAELVERAHTDPAKPLDIRVTNAINDMARSLYTEGATMHAVMCGQILHAALLAMTLDNTEEDFVDCARLAFRAHHLYRKQGAN